MPLSISCDKLEEVAMGGWGRAGTCGLCLCWWQMQPGIVRELGSVLGSSAAGAQVEGKAWHWLSWLITASSCAERGMALRGL